LLWEEISSYNHAEIDKNIPVLFSIGSIEQHGPALPVSTDSLIGWSLCLEIDKQIQNDVIILPQIKMCYSQHHMGFPGTLTVSHETLINYLCEIIESVILQGFRNILILNSHGGNEGIMQITIEKIGSKFMHVNIFGTSWWKISQHELETVQESGLMGNGHAAEFEFSLVEYLRKDLIDNRRKSNGSRPNIGSKWFEGDLLQSPIVKHFKTFKEMTVDGTYGLTKNANIEKGRKIFHYTVKQLIDLIKDVQMRTPDNNNER